MAGCSLVKRAAFGAAVVAGALLLACDGNGKTGAPGEPGLAGPSGPSGPAGAQGLAGPQGEVGPQGPTGPQGSTGPQGEAGPQGVAGPAGAQGAPGPAGAMGPVGPQGPTGPRGPAGVVFTGAWSDTASYAPSDVVTYHGSTWIVEGTVVVDVPPPGPGWALLAAAGETGPQGLQGEVGPQGPTGPTGPQGAQGPQGVQGLQGSIGLTGAAGPSGPSGPSGPQGAQGSQGLQGPTGATGAAGPSGPSGPPGPAGAGGLLAHDANGVKVGTVLAISGTGPTVVTPAGYQVNVTFTGGYVGSQLYWSNSNCTGTAWMNSGSAPVPAKPTWSRQVYYSAVNGLLFIPAEPYVHGQAFTVETHVASVESVTTGACNASTSTNGGWLLQQVSAADIGLPEPMAAPLTVSGY